jgi:hypothetical protein
MKRILLLSAFFFTALFTFGQAEMTFESVNHDFGEIQFNGNGTFIFTYTNTGNQPLIILDVKSSCGCTTPQYSKEPLAPGASSAITVKYDTTREGAFTKTVTILSTAKNSPIELVITGTVLKMQATSTEKTLN